MAAAQFGEAFNPVAPQAHSQQPSGPSSPTICQHRSVGLRPERSTGARPSRSPIAVTDRPLPAADQIALTPAPRAPPPPTFCRPTRSPAPPASQRGAQPTTNVARAPIASMSAAFLGDCLAADASCGVDQSSRK